MSDPEETICEHCGDDYELREGCDPTKYCDNCAHELCDKYESTIESLQSQLAKARSDALRYQHVKDHRLATRLGELSTSKWDEAIDDDIARKIREELK